MQRYGVVYADIWMDGDYKKMSVEAKYVYLYLLSSPHSNMAGYYSLPDEYAAYDLGMKDTDYRKAVAELSESGFVFAKKNRILVRSYLKHNPVHNDKQAKGAWNSVDRQPLDQLTVEFTHCCLLYAPSIVQYMSKEWMRFLYDHHVTEAGIDISLKLAALREDYALLLKNLSSNRDRTEAEH